MSGGVTPHPNLEWKEGLVWCCDTLGYVTPSDRWDHVEDAMEAYERRHDAHSGPLPAPGFDAASDRFVRAMGTAARLHAGQYRKGTQIPYLSHLLGTCAIALEHGADEDQAIAALLHDVLEDVTPTDAARAEVAAFGVEVLRIVEACTDSDAHPKPPWRDRKLAYLERLRTEDRAALLVSASDKLHNARSILSDLHRHGRGMLARFNPESDQLWYYRALVTAFRSNPRHEPALLEELDRTVAELERLATRDDQSRA